MDSMPVNWDVLDSLVVEFAKSEQLLEDPSSPAPSSPSASSSPCPSSSSYQSRLLIGRIRRAIEAGDVDRAMDLLRLHAPSVLHDHRILFRLQKQRFIELLRKGTDRDRDLAVQCLRISLAPCALDAYPEAYEEFKHVLLALIYDKEDKTSPVANEWSQTKRSDLAGSLSSILRAHFHAYDPIFLLTLRYLMSIHKVFCFRQGISSPISDLTERLLFVDRDPPLIPQESLVEAPPFSEVDIQALAHAAELTRQAAVDSLRFAKGDVFEAFQNELCRMKLDILMLDELVREYCTYRGFIESAVTTSDILHSSPRDYSSTNQKCGASSLSDDETSVNYTGKEGGQELISDAMHKYKDVEMRLTHETTENHEECSTSEVNSLETRSRRLRRIRNDTSGHRMRKRWRGRAENVEDTPASNFSESNIHGLKGSALDANENLLSEEQASRSSSSIQVVNLGDQNYEVILEMMELANKGMVKEVVEEVNTLDPEFFDENPFLLFQLKQVEFLKLVNSGDHAMALKIACAHLGPLAAKHEALIKPMKETLLALLKLNEDAMTKGLSILATSLQAAMSRRFGIQEPQLMKVMRATLHTHNEWFKLQMCRDRFEELLKINVLKEVDAPLPSITASKVSDDCSHGSSQVTSSESKLPESCGSQTQASSSDLVFEENAVLKVMEFLALPRSDAIHLLRQYDGNAETVIQQLFA